MRTLLNLQNDEFREFISDFLSGIYRYPSIKIAFDEICLTGHTDPAEVSLTQTIPHPTIRLILHTIDKRSYVIEICDEYIEAREFKSA